MIIVLILLGLVITTLAVGKFMLSIRFNKEVKTLFSQSKSIPGKSFSYNQLQGLPEPVQRYFKHVMKDGQPYISYARLIHKGQFRTAPDKDWMNIRGKQYFTMEKPGFIWKGSTAMFTARDMYISDKGRLVVSLLSLIKVADGHGEKYNQGELLRWLCESVWFPTNLLPNENLQWTPVDTQTAQLNFKYNDLSLSCLVTFSSDGEIKEFQTKRYMGEDALETWIGKTSDYKEMNGIFIPTSIEASYALKNGNYTYAKFYVEKLEYDIPEKF